MITKIVRSIINSMGLEIHRKRVEKKMDSVVNKFTMESALRRAGQRGIKPATIIDVGAAEGKWSLQAMQIWPDAAYCLFEPLQERAEELTLLEKKHPKLHYINRAASNVVGETSFYVSEDLDGSGIADNGSGSQVRKINTTTIDIELEKLKLNGPYLIKLDTHGFEVPIFEGSIHALTQAELVIIECYGFKIAPNSLLFWQMCKYMEQKGFRLLEIVDVMNRAKDEAFWQCDAFFIPSGAPCFSSNTYH